MLVEREPIFQDDIARRLTLADDPARRAAVSKAVRMKPAPTPLFGDVDLPPDAPIVAALMNEVMT